MPQPKPKRPGRPKLPKGAAKAETLRVRVTADELKALEKTARSSKQTVSGLIRTILATSVNS
jgi:hypothetical protein